MSPCWKPRRHWGRIANLSWPQSPFPVHRNPVYNVVSYLFYSLIRNSRNQGRPRALINRTQDPLTETGDLMTGVLLTRYLLANPLRAPKEKVPRVTRGRLRILVPLMNQLKQVVEDRVGMTGMMAGIPPTCRVIQVE